MSRLLPAIVLLLSLMSSFSSPLQAHNAAAATSAPGVWQKVSTTGPSARYHASMEYDPATSQLILFGGYGSYALGDTWAWDGTTWTRLSPTDSPTPREGASMAYDAATGQLVLFGGLASKDVYSSDLVNDTWTWDGTNWIQLFPTASPPALAYGNLAYDPATGQLILFSSGTPNGTWSWDGTNWTELSPQTTPPLRDWASMEFDPVSGKIILFGGVNYYGTANASVGVFADTWAWDGTNWNQLSPADSPTARFGASMAYDEGTHQLVLSGGFDDSDFVWDTWAWDGTNWSLVNDAAETPRIFNGVMANDSATHQLIYFGDDQCVPSSCGDTWSFVPNTDSTPPSTSITAETANAKPYTYGDWTSQSVTVSLDSFDPGGVGVGHTFYSIDGGDQQIYFAPFTISDEGDHSLTYWSVDLAGNEETHVTVPVRIDLTVPTVTYTGNQGTYGANDAINITCTATDALSGVASTDCHDISGPATSFMFGVNYFGSIATDFAGNCGAGSGSFTVVPPDSTTRANLALISLTNPQLFVFVRTGRTGGAPVGYFSYNDGSVYLANPNLLSLTVVGNQAAIYGTGRLGLGPEVSFTLDVQTGQFSTIVRLRLSNGYDSGDQHIYFERMSSSS